ncbi:HTH domain-containing protein, partial [Kribbella turkmenica]
MNRIDRLYALVEELRAAGRVGRTARQLAAHFEVSVRTIERDLSALGQAGAVGNEAGPRRRLHARPVDEPAAAQLHAGRSGGGRGGAQPERTCHVPAGRPQRVAEDHGRDAGTGARRGPHHRGQGPPAGAAGSRPGRRRSRDRLAGRPGQSRAPDPLHRRRRRGDGQGGRAAVRRGRSERFVPHGLV